MEVNGMTNVNEQQLQLVENTLTTALLAWSATSVAVGTIMALVGRKAQNDDLVGFGRQTAAWGAVDALIAGAGVLSRRRRGPLCDEDAAKNNRAHDSIEEHAMLQRARDAEVAKEHDEHEEVVDRERELDGIRGGELQEQFARSICRRNFEPLRALKKFWVRRQFLMRPYPERNGARNGDAHARECPK